MKRKHVTISLVLPVLLIAAFMLAACSDSNDPNVISNPTDNPNDQLVSDLSLFMGKTSISGYYGSSDTVSVRVTARDAGGSPVSGAHVTFSTPSMGFLEYVGGNETDSDGEVLANYVITVVQDGSATITANVGSITQSTQVTVTSKDIRVAATASPQNAVVVAGEMAQSQIRISVLNELGVAVAGVPISLEILSDPGATLSEPVFNPQDAAYTSTLTADEVNDVVEVILRAYVDLPDNVAPVPQSAKGAQLPVVIPGGESGNRTDGAREGVGEVRREGASPQTDDRPKGKGLVEIPTWEEGAGPGSKGGARAGIATVVDADTVTVRWTTWGSQVSEIYLDVNPSELAVEPGQSGQAFVSAVAADENYNGIPNLQIYLRLSNVDPAEGVGTISIPSPTDSTGGTTATISTNGQYGTWVVEARTTPTQEDPWTDTLTVTEGSQIADAYVTISPSQIFVEPGNSAQATVTAIAYDANNNGVPYYQLYMTLHDQSGNPVGGTITPPDTTDVSGLTSTTINTNGAYGNWTVDVRAYPNQEVPTGSANLTVEEGSSIASINMTATPTFIRAEPDANKQIDVTATARDEDNYGLEDRIVFFRLVDQDDPNEPVGTITSSDTTDSAGVVDATVNTEGQYGIWDIEARAYPTQEDPMVTRTVEVEEGSDVQEISVTVSPDVLIPAPETADTADVYLVCFDEVGTGVQDAEPHLSVRNIIPEEPTGTVSQPDSTGQNGATTAKLITNGNYGTWIVEASPYEESDLVFADTVEVLEGTAQYINVEPDTNKIAVRGTNGLEQTPVRATVYDENDVPIQDSTWVYYVAEQFPWEEGDEYRVRINDNYGQGSPFDDPRTDLFGLPYDSALTSNGTATVTLKSGVRKGLIRMRVFTKLAFDSLGADIETMFDGVQIVAGPPDSIEVGVGPNGFDGGSSVWDIEVSARVFDARNNEVLSGYQVYFSVSPDIATIWDYAFTGNESFHTNVTTPGVAYSVLSYHSEFTNEEVTITAWTLNADGEEISDDLEYNLPLQSPQGVLTSVPTNFDFGENPGEDYATFRMRLDVFDGHNYPINGQLVSFNPTKGRIFRTPDINQEPVYFGITGPEDWGTQIPDQDPNGVSIRWFLITVEEAFPVPNVPETTVNVGASIIGVPEATVEPVTIYLIQ